MGRRVPKVTASAVALAINLEGDKAFTSLVLTLNRSAQFTTFTLADPHRVIVDLQDVEFRVPPLTGTTGRGLIKSFRYGLLSPGKSRIVIDLEAPASVDKADIVALRGADTVQLRVSLTPIANDAFIGAAADSATRRAPPTPAAGAARATVASGIDAGAIRAAALSVPLARASQAEAGAAQRRKGSRPVIVLDPGHGGVDAGTVGASNVAEKDVVLRFGKLLRDKLRATGRFDVYLTREIDMFIKLDERVRIARGLHCNLFISLHTDSVPPQYAHLNVRGATIYTMGAVDDDAKAQKLAERENLSDVFAGVEAHQDEQPEVAGILNDLMRRETSNSSQAFTGTLLEYMKKSTGLSREPHRHAAFKVLRSPDLPSVLVELGYLSNREDEKLLVSRDWQDQVAVSIGKAVEAYFSKGSVRSPY